MVEIFFPFPANQEILVNADYDYLKWKTRGPETVSNISSGMDNLYKGMVLRGVV